LGAGEMAELALECLTREGVRAAIVANRTYERADELARRYGATALHYDECWTGLAQVDVVISSTAAPHAIVGVEHVRPALAARGRRVPLALAHEQVPPRALGTPAGGRRERSRARHRGRGSLPFCARRGGRGGRRVARRRRDASRTRRRWAEEPGRRGALRWHR